MKINFKLTILLLSSQNLLAMGGRFGEWTTYFNDSAKALSGQLTSVAQGVKNMALNTTEKVNAVKTGMDDITKEIMITTEALKRFLVKTTEYAKSLQTYTIKTFPKELAVNINDPLYLMTQLMVAETQNLENMLQSKEPKLQQMVDLTENLLTGSLQSVIMLTQNLTDKNKVHWQYIIRYTLLIIEDLSVIFNQLLKLIDKVNLHILKNVLGKDDTYVSIQQATNSARGVSDTVMQSVDYMNKAAGTQITIGKRGGK